MQLREIVEKTEVFGTISQNKAPLGCFLFFGIFPNPKTRPDGNTSGFLLPEEKLWQQEKTLKSS